MEHRKVNKLALSLVVAVCSYAGTAHAQETIAGLTVLNPRTNMYMPFEQQEKVIYSVRRQRPVTQVRSRRSVQMPREHVAPPPRGDVDVQSYRVSPVPGFLIEEAMEDRTKRGAQVSTTTPGVDGTENELTNLNMAIGEVKDVKAKEKKKVKPYVRRPKLWYGGPWRKG